MNGWVRAPESRPLVLGHRGARHAAPENTLAAFELAIDEGADGIELDVRLDAGGNVIVLHDRTLARVTGWHDTRDVELVRSSELTQIDVGRGERIPTLKDVLDWATRGAHRVNVELKQDVSNRGRLVEAVIAALSAEPRARELVLCSSFHPGIVRSLATRGIATGWLVHSGQRLLKHAPAFSLLGACAVHPERVLVSAERIERWKRAGALVNVWTVNAPLEARRLSAVGVDAIITDVPGMILTALD